MRRNLSNVVRSLALAIALVGCGLSLTGIDATDGGTTSDASFDTTLQPPKDASTDTADVVVDTGPPPTSCKEIKQRDPLEISGKKTIVLPNRGAVTVHCEMQLLGGGFTLVGRSSSAGQTNSNPFGWTSASGSVDSDDPYSLDATGLEFKQIMIAEWKASGPPTSGVIIDAPASFLTAYADSSIDIRSIPSQSVEILGACTSGDFNSGVQMIRHIGFTSSKSQFSIRDLSTLDVYGLKRTRLDLFDNGCGRSMNLHDKRGAIWVR